MYIIKKGALYVSRPGSLHSYTKYLQLARVFDRMAEALSQLCPENETIVRIEDEMTGGKQ
jgi:hypothetical protein